MSDYDDSSSQPPNDQTRLDGIRLYYRAILKSLVSTGESLELAGQFVPFINDPRFSGLSLLHARNAEIVDLAARWVEQTLAFLDDPDPDEGDDQELISPDLAEEGRLGHEAH